MNEYLQGMQNEAAARGVPFEEPNGWSQMLMNIASTNNSWSAEQAQKQMDFQERMSNTAHQREIADLQAAGLNPILSAKLGGASTPSGSAATADTSIVSSIVGLMNKMLDVQGTSAAAAYNASGGSNVTYGYGSDSGYSNYLADVDDSKTEVNGVDYFKSAGHMSDQSKETWTKGLQAIGVPEKQAKAIVQFADNAGYKINEGLAKVGNAALSGVQNVKSSVSGSNSGSGVLNKVGNAAKKAVGAVANFGKWLVTGKKSSSNNGGLATR